MKATMYKIYDENTDEFLQEVTIKENGEGVCYGQRTGHYGELCGGCDGCILQQAEYYGCKIISEDFEID